MTHALKTAKSKILITLPTSLNVALEAAQNAGIPSGNVLLLEGKNERFLNIQQLMEHGAQFTPEEPFRIPRGKTNAQICGYLNFSSGTTGLPKAVCCSSHSFSPLIRGYQLYVLIKMNRLCSHTRTSLPSVISLSNYKQAARTKFWP